MRSTATTSGGGSGNQSGPAQAPETARPRAPLPGNRTPAGASRARHGPLAVYLAALAAVVGIPVHLYWALGGTWGLPGGAATAGLPGLHAANAVVSVLLAAGAALLSGLTRPWARRPPAPVMLTPLWLGSVVAVSHGLYGLAAKGLYAAGAHSAVSYPESLTAAQENHAALLDPASPQG